jgi:hypothetical protein
MFFLICFFIFSYGAEAASSQEIIFNKHTSITEADISDMVDALIQAVKNEDPELLKTLIDDFHALELGSNFWVHDPGDKSETLTLEKDFDPELLKTVRHYCFGAGVEDVPMNVWEYLAPVLRMEGEKIIFYDYPPHPEDIGDIYEKIIVYPDTNYLEQSLSFGIDASFKVWQVGDYYHGIYNGLQIYFCHSIKTNKWFIRCIFDS